MGSQYRKKEWLLKKYENDGWSQNEIAEYCGVTQGTIFKWMRKFSISSRDMAESHLGKRNGSWIDSPIKDYHWMYREYVLNRKTLRDISKEQRVGLRTVSRWLKTHGIDARQGADSFVKLRDGYSNTNWKGGSFCPNCAREKSYTAAKCSTCHFEFLRDNPKLNPNYSGKSDITYLLRDFSKINWSPKILERDNYTCVSCGNDAGDNLNAHHIVPFVVLRDQIILENPDLDLSKEDNRLALVGIAKDDWRFSDLDNGVTLCKTCHVGEHSRLRHDIDEVVYIYRATVTEVKDPDTIVADIDLGFGMTKEEEIRLYGLNAPETHSKDPEQDKALRGKEIVKEVCAPGKEILIRTFKPGKYGRWLALVILDSLYLNTSLVKNGLAEEEYYV